MSSRHASPGIVAVNPLPAALRHYTTALVAHLVEEGVSVRVVTPDLEIGGRPRLVALRMVVAGVLTFLRVARSRETVLVLWPIFGFLEPFFWAIVRRRGGRTLVIVHDPKPLRRQRGEGRLAVLAGRVGVRRGVEIVAHTRMAADALVGRGLGVTHVVPHPVAQVGPADAPSARELLVAGQFKGARDLGLLERLAPRLPGWRLAVVGRGWPDVAGWVVDARFLSEAELDARLRAATAVLLPYDWYFQSGIGVRCFELGVPVVGARHEFLASLFGDTWPGLVEGDAADEEAWAAAVMRAAERRGTVPTGAARTRIGRAWASVLEQTVARARKDGRGRADR